MTNSKYKVGDKCLMIDVESEIIKVRQLNGEWLYQIKLLDNSFTSKNNGLSSDNIPEELLSDYTNNPIVKFSRLTKLQLNGVLDKHQ